MTNPTPPLTECLSHFIVRDNYFPSVCNTCGLVTSSENIGVVYLIDDYQTYCVACVAEGKTMDDPDEMEWKEYVEHIVASAAQQNAELVAENERLKASFNDYVDYPAHSEIVVPLLAKIKTLKAENERLEQQIKCIRNSAIDVMTLYHQGKIITKVFLQNERSDGDKALGSLASAIALSKPPKEGV